MKEVINAGACFILVYNSQPTAPSWSIRSAGRLKHIKTDPRLTPETKNTPQAGMVLPSYIQDQPASWIGVLLE